MPTREQVEAVTREIEILKGGLNVVRLSGDRVVDASEGQGRFLFWDDLDGQQRQDALSAAIDWEGFTESQRDDVIRRVLDGEDIDFWMDGVEVDASSERAPGATQSESLSKIDLAELRIEAHQRYLLEWHQAQMERNPEEDVAYEEIRADEQAARARDDGEADAATYDQCVAEGAVSMSHPEAAPDPRDLEQAVSEVERTLHSPKEQFHAILRGDHGQLLSESIDQALSRMQGDGHER